MIKNLMRYAAVGMSLALAACGTFSDVDVYNDPAVKDPMNPNRTLLPSDARKSADNRLNLFGSTPEKEKKVNAYLWQAALSVLKEFPLDKADAEGRYIMTEWYTPHEGEQFKIYVQLMQHELTSQSLGVKVYRRQGSSGGKMKELLSNPELETKIRDEILNRARELRAQNS